MKIEKHFPKDLYVLRVSLLQPASQVLRKLEEKLFLVAKVVKLPNASR